MKKAIMTGAVLASLSLRALAASPADTQAYAVPPMPQSCSSSAFGDVCLHAFGGRNTLIVPPQTKGVSCKGIEVQLFQLSSRLAMPVGDKKTLASEDCGSVAMFLPAVKERTYFRVAYTNPASPAAVPLDTLVAVYPVDLWASLREWSESNNLVVNDSGGKLATLLQEQKIKYSPMLLPDQSGRAQHVCIWVPVSDNNDESPLDCADMLVLHERADGLPVIHTLEMPGRYRTDVQMPLLPTLADNPLVQKTFIDLIQLSLKGG